LFDYCMFDLSVYYMYLQYFDTVGWVFWPVKTVSHITYTVLEETLNPAQSINQSINQSTGFWCSVESIRWHCWIFARNTSFYI